MNNVLVYSTSTGQQALDLRPEAPEVAPVREEYWEEYCAICGRCTDHSGEHTDRVEVSEYERREYEDGLVMHYIRTYEAIGPLTYEGHLVALEWREDY